MKERRLTNIQIRKNENDDEMIIEGKAIAFESPETYYGETEVIDPHALDECNMKDVVLRYNHNDTNYVLARTRNKSLEIDVREDGAYFKAHLIPTTTNKDIYLMVQEGLVDKCSFAFADYEYEYNTDTNTCRIIKIREIFDFALVDFPFYNNTNVQVARSLDTGEEMHKALAQKRARHTLAKRLERKLLIARLG